MAWFTPKPRLGSQNADLEKALLLALFGALCLFFSTLENILPKPVPFFRLGLANLPILLAFPVFRGRDIIMLTLLKVLGQALINGTLASYVFLFSLAGSVASVLVMYVLWRACRSRISAIGISLAGALASNAVQILLSIYYIFGPGAWLIAPVMMGLGVATGLAVGVLVVLFAGSSQWYMALLASGSPMIPTLPAGPQAAADIEAIPAKPRKRRWRAPVGWDLLGRTVSPVVLFWSGIGILPAFLFQENLGIRCLQVGLFIILAILAGKRVSAPYFLAMLFSITLLNLFVPAGLVLVSIGGFAITQQALIAGLHKGIGIVGLVMISLATVRPRLRLPGNLGGLLGQMFRLYEVILSNRGHFDARHPVASIDRILYGLGSMPEVGPLPPKSPSTSPAGWILVTILVILQWLLLFVKI